MKRTVSYLFYQQKGFDYNLQKQPSILTQIKYFCWLWGEKSKQPNPKEFATKRKDMGRHRVRVQTVEFHFAGGRFFTSKFLHPLNRRSENNSVLPNGVKTCLQFQELWDLQLGSLALQGSRGGMRDKIRAHSPGYMPALLGLPRLR